MWSCESVALGLVKNHRDAARELKAGRWKRGYSVCLGDTLPLQISPKAAKCSPTKVTEKYIKDPPLRFTHSALGSPRAAPQGSSAEVRGDASSCNLLIFCPLSFHSADVYRGSRSAAKTGAQHRHPAAATGSADRALRASSDHSSAET
ncbi:hypothetical protein SRHO_G00093240 [Serrasalmus rhombeus]